MFQSLSTTLNYLSDHWALLICGDPLWESGSILSLDFAGDLRFPPILQF